MRRDILLVINGRSYVINENPPPMQIKEDDEIQIIILNATEDETPEIFFEDHQSSVLFKTSADGKFLFETTATKFFSECFGYSVARIQFEEDFFLIPFDVMARKTSVEQAHKMIRYLASHSDKLIKSCLSRSSVPSGVIPHDESDPETILSCAEDYIEVLQSSRIELVNGLRERLVPIRQPLWKTRKTYYEIDPLDILNNLDALTPIHGCSDVFLRGQNFSLGEIDVSTLQPTANVLENHILLGGLYSIRRKVDMLREQLNDLDRSGMTSGGIDGYESFSRLMLRLTAGGMVNRCVDVLDSTNVFIKFFEQSLGVIFQGEVNPIMTPYARGSRVYKALFTKLSYWYGLGIPSLGGINFLMKLKSLSKIYELFMLFQLIEYLFKNRWELINAVPHPTMGEHVPCLIELKFGNEKMVITYEPRIGVLNSNSRHMDLIDVYHYAGAEYPYWMPDLVIQLHTQETVKYLILDAKYSTAGSVKTYHIPDLFRKYYLGMATYDEEKSLSTNGPIVAVFAIYSLGYREDSYISYWPRQGLHSRTPRIPMVGGIGLMIDNTSLFEDSLGRALDLARK